MLRSPRVDIEAVLAPAQVALARTGAPRRVIDCAGPGAATWSAALAALDTALGDDVRRGARLHVVLSNRFVRYAVVPWQEGLHGAAEDAAYMRHVFTEVYGSVADRWDLCASAGSHGQPRLASAIDIDLLAALRRTCAARGLALRAVCPRLGSIFNRYRKRIAASGWLVMAESNCLCIALFDGGRWLSASVARLPVHWRHALPDLLERAACLANPAAAADQVYWWSDGEGEPPAPHARFTFHRLHAEAP